MSSIAAGVNAERTNRWLLIGAAVLAVVAGALIFVALANFGSDDDNSTSDSNAGTGSNKVLVAKSAIAAGDTLSADLFDEVSVADSLRVEDAISNAELIEGRQATLPIRRGAQISTADIGSGIGDGFKEDLTFKVPFGMRAYAMTVAEDTAVGGLLTPNDKVDLIVQYTTKENEQATTEFLHIELFASNVEVLAVAQATVEEQVSTVPAVEGEDGVVPAAPGDDQTGIARRPEDFDTNEGARTVTLALSLEQAAAITQWLELEDATIRVALRAFGDDSDATFTPIVREIFR